MVYSRSDQIKLLKYCEENMLKNSRFSLLAYAFQGQKGAFKDAGFKVSHKNVLSSRLSAANSKSSSADFFQLETILSSAIEDFARLLRG